MQHKLIQSVGVAWALIYALFIVWIYATEPRTFKDVASGVEVAAGTYRIDQQKFDTALQLFRQDQFRAARDEWQRADPQRQDAKTHFYIAYAFYREGWGRLYNDDGLFKQGVEAVNLAIKLSPDGALKIEDDNLQMHTAAELKAELEQGTERSLGDLNPLKVFRKRK